MQRARLLSAAVVVVDELGWSGVTVGHIASRARVSRRTFYELFEDREDCLVAMLESIVGRVREEVAAAGLEGLVWRERVRVGLWRVLCFFDRERVLARVCVVQSARGDQRVLECREGVLRSLAGVIDEGRRGEGAGGGETPPVLVAEGLLGAIVAIVHNRLYAQEEPEALSGLLGELMAMIVLPYLGAGVARKERARPVPPLPTGAATSSRVVVAGGVQSGGDEGVLSSGVPSLRLTYRTARVLEDVASSPGLSNRVVGERVGITDQGQVSKLLARLQRLGLLTNTSPGHSRGEPNAWRLTPTGEQVAQSIGVNGSERGRSA